ncbi:glucose-1-phosphate thymidylyltransferase [Halobacterium litoreum]|uniref:Glucose-1-phosphate thymidylyltransferase n=1 Tax=Halobacterium litoreum TaxID=2039234 RepID=A0ABD5NB55_9EURY|nr:glucose-1-phosphate thymidylyltransferase [Halobacterium litoreum]UHH14680.1 glucose-1-phosphate thymidylyltransferase [Halobacterium litoreum]
MLGVLWTPSELSPRVEPARSAALYPVAGAPAVERAADAMVAAGVDELAVVTDAADVSEWGTAADVVDEVAADLGKISPRGHESDDRVVVALATAVLAGETIRRVAAARPAAAVRTGDEAVERPPLAFSVSVERARRAASVPKLADALEHPEPVDCPFGFDVRRPWNLLEANGVVLDEQSRSVRGDVHGSAEIRGDVVVEPGAVVESGCVVEGPAYLSPGVRVGPNAYVRGRTFLGREVRIGHAVEVKNSVLLDDARAPHLTYVGDSVVGPGANLGAGTQVANLRHDDEPVRVAHDGDRVSTGRRKFGAVVGAGAKLGIGTCLDAGVTLAAGASTKPGEVLTRDRGL